MYVLIKKNLLIRFFVLKFKMYLRCFVNTSPDSFCIEMINHLEKIVHDFIALNSPKPPHIKENNCANKILQAKI